MRRSIQSPVDINEVICIHPPGSPRLADQDGAASQPVLLFPHPHLHGTSRYGPRDSDSDNAL
jgi:hypothetical protein